MSEHSATGKVIEINEEVQVSDSFKKRSFALETTDEKYAQFLEMEFVQDAVDKLDSITIGQSVEVFYNVRGRKYEKEGETRYFTSLNAWKITAQ